MITLRNGTHSASIDPAAGGRLASLRIDGAEVIGGAPAVGGGDPAWFSGSFPMAPFAGNVADAAFIFRGSRYELSPNNGPHATHGLVCALPWHVTAQGERELRLRIDLPDPWPFGGWAEQRFVLSDAGLAVTLSCGNDVRDMPVSLGFHPWFQRTVDGQAAQLDFAPEARFAEGRPGLFGEPTGDLGQRPWDDPFRHPGAPTITWGSRRLTLSSSEDTWLVYERQPEGFCVEPLTAPPDGLTPGRARIAGPGHPVSLRFGLDWGTALPSPDATPPAPRE